MIQRSYLRLALFTAVLLVAWLAYRPGLTGGFVFDDFANLPALGETGPVDNSAAFARYVTSGTADPIGRPLAMASFLVDAQDWPAAPRPFKRTNVLLHLLNGALLYVLLRAFGREWTRGAADPRLAGRADYAALISASIWLLHPLFVSTTLYIVQREAMLPATFCLTGMLAWVKARRLLALKRTRAGSLMAVFAVAGCTLLASLSKANGLLLPSLILIVERIFLPAAPRPDGSAGRVLILTMTACKVATAAIAFALIYLAWTGMAHGIPHRPWTEGQRLLTEPRIVWQYLGQLWFPHPYTAGVFNDTTAVSTALWHPWTTAAAIAGIALLCLFAWARRRDVPALAGAILFFLTAHLLESSSVPLELYFEHRNYLPAVMMFWPAGLWLAGVRMKLSASASGPIFPSLGVRHALAALLLASMAGMTYANTSVWGDAAHQATLWARLNPTSARAQVTAAQEEIQQGHALKAVARLTPLIAARPGEVQIAFNLIAAHCQAGDLSAADMATAGRALRITRDPGALIAGWYARTIPVALNGECAGLSIDALRSLTQAGLDNPNLPPGRRQDLEHALGAMALATNEPDTALLHFDRGLALDPHETVALRQAAELGSAGHAELGLEHLSTYDSLPSTAAVSSPGMAFVHTWVLRRQDYWPRERKRLVAALQADAGTSR
jgi:tetratricopeptide (TPR) repeat protein